MCRIEGRPPRLDMELYPYLPKANVATTSTRDYMTLLAGSLVMTNKSTMLLEHNLKQLKLPTFLREYDKLASQCASEGAEGIRTTCCDYRRVGADRPSPSAWWNSRNQSSPGFPTTKSRRHLRLPVYAVPEQGSGSGAGTMRVHRAPPQRHRSRQPLALGKTAYR